MSEVVQERNYRTPEQEQAAKGANTPDPYDMTLEDINPKSANKDGGTKMYIQGTDLFAEGTLKSDVVVRVVGGERSGCPS